MSFPTATTMLSFSSSSSSSKALKKTNTNGSRKRSGKRRIDVDVRSKSSSSSSGNLFQGKKRSKAKLPGYAFYVSPEDFSSTMEGDERLPEHIEAVVKKGATMVVLHDPTSSLSTREFYNLAVNIKTNLRERCALLVVDRTDIVSSAEIDGVVLSTDGVPTVVARKSMPEGSLVVVSAGENAKNAEIAAKEGCDVLFVSDASVAKKIRDNVSVPIFSNFRDAADLTSNIDTIVAAGCDGVTLYENANKKDAAIADTIGAALSALGGDGEEDKNFLNKEETTERKSAIPPTQFTSVIGEQGERLLNKEREILDDIVNFLETSAPELEEIKLLLDARKGLDELFLIVIVGEFNAGKSSVINAVLGDKFLAEGILPTTNEITVLRYGESKQRVQSEDGFYNQDIPVDLLKQVSIVDTPGTNVILKRQQRLTEEFVPRADLVLFVLSADRPMTESEVKFLSYIKKWGKKVVFVLNKCDLLETDEDRNEVTKFVRDNAKRLLGVDNAPVIPVAARNALRLKKANASMKEYAETGFPAFEEYVNSYLGGGSGNNKSGENRSGEALRLKLATPLNVSELLLSASKQILDAEMSVAETEVAAASGVDEQMNAYKETMVKDASEQVNFVRANVNGAVKRANALVDETLRLENALDLITTYIVGADYSELDDLDVASNSSGDSADAASGGEGNRKKRKKKYSKFVKAYQSTVLGSADQELKKTVKEFSKWLKRNNDARLSSYLKAVSSRGFDTTVTASGIKEFLESSEKGAPKINSAAIAVADNFDNEAAAYKLDEEMRSAVYGSLGSSAGALVSAFVLSGFLSSMSEDILAYLLAAAVGYVGILSLPLKRQECKAKIQRAAEALVEDVERELLKELAEEIDATSDRVDQLVAPWEAAARVERARVQKCLEVQEKYATEVENLAIEVENL
jgi:small GTP-binding protein